MSFFDLLGRVVVVAWGTGLFAAIVYRFLSPRGSGLLAETSKAFLNTWGLWGFGSGSPWTSAAALVGAGLVFPLWLLWQMLSGAWPKYADARTHRLAGRLDAALLRRYDRIQSAERAAITANHEQLTFCATSIKSSPDSEAVGVFAGFFLDGELCGHATWYRQDTVLCAHVGLLGETHFFPLTDAQWRAMQDPKHALSAMPDLASDSLYAILEREYP